MRREYDFRFSGLRAPGSREAENVERVQSVRAVLIGIAGGFTEIEPGVCMDLIPGEGMGYVVTLSSKTKVRALESGLRRLADRFGLPVPKPYEAVSGPRRTCSLFLIPEKANPTPSGGYRRALFRQTRWTRIENALVKIAPLRVEFVYGEWLASASAPTVVQDVSRMFIVAGASLSIRRDLVRLLRAHVFDKGIECDQECLYLSVGGAPALVTAP